MSKTIDEKVVSLQFNNQNFERNVKTSLQSIEQLNRSLEFKKSNKGLESLAQATDQVKVKFSALEIAGATMVANLTNSFVNLGKSMVKSLTFDQVAQGWKKMDDKLQSVQTLVNSTGLSVEEIESYLSRLMRFSDETSYSFTDMTAALAQMTSSGGDIKKLIPMITGIANATAFAGKGSAEFSRVIYNLNQSYSRGSLQAIDWKSVIMAGANSKQLTQEIIRAGEELGTLQKGTVDVGSFLDSLKDGWANTEVMEKAFGRFSVISEAVAKITEDNDDLLWSEVIDDIDKLKSGLITVDDLQNKIVAGTKDQKVYTADQVKLMKELANESNQVGISAIMAAQSAKTFKEAIDATKDAMSSAFMSIFEDILGNYNEQKRLWTDLANTLYDWLVAPLKSFEERLKAVMEYNPFTQMMNVLNKIDGSGLNGTIKKVDNLSNSLEKYQDIVSRVWRGDYKNQPYRKGLLEKDGWNFDVVQELVNETDRRAGYGNGWKVVDSLTIDDVTAAEKKYGIVQKENTKILDKLTDEQLESVGLTKEEIKMYRDLEEQSKKTGKSINELVEEMEHTTGRDLLIQSFRNIGSTLITLFNTIGEAWSRVFPPKSEVQMYGMLRSLRDFTQAIRDFFGEIDDSDGVTSNVEKIVMTLQGLFSILGLIVDVITGVFKAALNILGGLFGKLNDKFDLTNHNILDITAAIGKAIYNFREWVHQTDGITKLLKIFVDVLKTGAKKLWDFIRGNQFLASILEKIVDKLREVKRAFKSWFSDLSNSDNKFGFIFGGLIDRFNKLKEYFKNSDSPARYIIEGFVKGVASGATRLYNLAKIVFTKFIMRAKEILGIHSPSRVFFGIGKFIIEGLLMGIKQSIASLTNVTSSISQALLKGFKGIGEGASNAFNGIFSTVKSVSKGIMTVLSGMVNKIAEFVRGIDFGKIFAGVIGVGLLLAVKKFTETTNNFINLADDAVKGITAPLVGMKNLMTSFGESLKINAQANNKKATADIIKSIGLTILAIAGALYIISKIKTSDLVKAGITVVLIGGLIAALALVMAKINKNASLKGTAKAIMSISGIIGLAVAMVLLALAMKTLSKFDWDSFAHAAAGMGVCVLALAGLIWVAGNVKYSPGQEKAIKQLGKMIRNLAVSLLLMVVVVKLSSKLKESEIAKATKFVGRFLLLLGSIVLINKFAGESNLESVSKLLTKISLSLILMVAAVKLAGLLKERDIRKGTKVMAAFAGFCAVLIAVSHFSGEHADKAGRMIQRVSLSLLMISVAMKIMGTMDASEVNKAVKAVTAVGLVIGALIALSHFSGKYAMQAGVMCLTVAFAILVLTGAIFLLGKMNTAETWKAVGIIAILEILFGGLIAVSKIANASKDTIKYLTTLILGIVILVVAVIALSFIKKDQLLAAGGVMAGVMLAFAAMMAASKFVNKKKIASLLATMGSLLLIVVALAFIVAKLAQLNPSNAIASAGSLAILMGGFALLMAATKMIRKKDMLNMVVTLGMLTLVTAALGAILVSMGQLNPGTAISSALSLAILIGALTVCLAAMTLLGNVGMTGLLVGAGVFAAFSLVVLPMMLIFMKELNKLNPSSMMPNVLAFATLLGSMTAVLAVLTVIGLGGPAALIGIGSLVALVLAIGGLCAALGWLQEKIPGLQDLLTNGIPILTQIGTAIGSFVGALIASFGTEVLGLLPVLGSNLSEFMINLQPFIEISKTIDGSLAKGVGFLSLAVVALSAAELVNGIANFLSGKGSMAKFGLELSQFMINLTPFIVGAKTLTPEMTSCVKNLADAILTLTAGNLLESLTKFITGGHSLTKFGEELGTLGAYMATFADNLGTFDDGKAKTVECASKAIKAMAEAAHELPNEGGWAGKILGENSIATFGGYLPELGTHMAEFVTNLGTFSNDQVSTVDCAGRAIQALGEAASNIPNEGGLWAKIAGDNSISKFGGYLPTLGTNLADFVKNLGVFNKNQIDTVDCAGKAITTLADCAKNLPNEGGLWAKLCGDNTLKDFGEALPDLGTNLKGFVDKLKGLDKNQAASVSAAGEALNGLGQILAGVKDDIADKMKDFGKNLPDLADKLSSFVTKLSNLKTEDITSSIGKVKSFASFVSDAKSIDSTSLKTFGTNLKSVATDGVQGFVDAIKKEEYKTSAKSGANALGEATLSSLKDSMPSDKIEEVGKNFVDGFARGIENNEYLSNNAANQLGIHALEHAKKAIDSNSPSKETMKIGGFFDTGFAIGIKKSSDKVTEQAESIGYKAKNGLSRAIAGMMSMFSSDIDTSPSIRPVLDLSDIEANAGNISNILGNQAVGVSANLNAISNGVNNRIQNNATNTDILSAISKLGSNLGSAKTGNTYNINGVTYDNGSEIQNAVEVLIRAANVERRV